MLALLVVGWLIYSSIASKAPETKLVNGLLRLCPNTPNCVSSEKAGSLRKIEPFTYTGSSSEAWNRLAVAVKKSSGVVIIFDDTYLRATYTSRIFRFVDDMEFRLDAGKEVIQVRSGSRVGKSDFGVNRKNVEKVRKIFNKY